MSDIELCFVHKSENHQIVPLSGTAMTTDLDAILGPIRTRYEGRDLRMAFSESILQS